MGKASKLVSDVHKSRVVELLEPEYVELGVKIWEAFNVVLDDEPESVAPPATATETGEGGALGFAFLSGGERWNLTMSLMGGEVGFNLIRRERCLRRPG
jgi:hypothetical protein